MIDEQQPHRAKAARLADDAGGRRWLVETLLLDDGQAAEVVAVVRHRYPDIAHMARYLERMHRSADGTLKRELLDIVEAVQAAGQQRVDEPELEPQAPAASSGCPHDVPNAATVGCPICDGMQAAQQPTQAPDSADVTTSRCAAGEPSTVASTAQAAIREARRNLARSQTNGPKTTARNATVRKAS